MVHRFSSTLLKKVGGSGFRGDVWIGLTKLEDYTQDYKWSDGITGSYRAWAEGEPFEEDVRHCVYVDTRSTAGTYISRWIAVQM